MRRKIASAISSILSGLMLYELIFHVSPYYQLSLLTYKVSAIIPFFFFTFLFIISFITLITKKLLQGVLVAVLVTSFLLLRLYGYIQPLYSILIFLLFIILELTFKNGKNHTKDSKNRPQNSPMTK